MSSIYWLLSSSEVTNEDQACTFHTLERKYIIGPSTFDKMRQRNSERDRERFTGIASTTFPLHHCSAYKADEGTTSMTKRSEDTR